MVAFQNLIFYGLSKTKVDPNDKTNMFRADLFSLFPNVVEVELWAGSYSLNLMSLLSVLGDASLSPSFKQLKIRDGKHSKWIKKAFSAIPDIEEQFATKKFVIKMETVKDRQGERDWFVIKPLQ